MQTLDELIAEKIIGIIRKVLLRIIHPDMVLDTVNQLNENEIERIKEKYGIEGIILDVDDTLRKEMKDIPICNKKWIESLKGKIKIIVLSNGVDGKIEKYFEENEIDYIGFAHKPLKRNFIKACEKMKISPDKVLVIGDSVIDDIYGGKVNNMKTALIKEVEDEGR